MSSFVKTFGILLLSAVYIMSETATADEGMWLFTDPPTQLLKDRYDFEPTQQWLEHVQRSAVRFNSGGSGSFVSADGLVFTNHHVGADTLAKLSTPERDLVSEGFHARTRDEERKAVDLELNVLQSIEDVTDRVNAAVKPGMPPADAQRARRAVINTIEQESLEKTQMRSDVVTLYQGAKYHLYRYKRYTDVRLVFAPEKEIAFFGGDPDNFEFPRYDLDICFFRAYENDKPAKVEHYLKWSKAGAAENELIFVAGHPGRTSRLNTVAHLEFLRDRQFPSTLNTIRRREVLLKTYSDEGLENARRAEDELFGYQNSRKARLGGLAGLQDPSIMEQKQSDEKALRDFVAKNANLKDAAAWVNVDRAMTAWDAMYQMHGLIERGAAFNTALFSIARDLVRLADENAKPNAERLPEYSESSLASLKQQLFSEAPIYKDLETVKLGDSLGMYLEWVGLQAREERDREQRTTAGESGRASRRSDSQFNEWKLLNEVLDGKSPRERGADLVKGTRLEEVAYRKELFEGGRAAIEASDDPMIKLARLVDPRARELRKAYEAQVDEPLRQAYAKIAEAKFAKSGTNQYPDATFTLRLAFGTVKGYRDQGEQIPPWTTLGGAYPHAEKHGNVYPFKLPESWIKAKDRLDLDTPFNFVSTADIIGGNSGSPVINRAGELVGIIFDGNIYSLVLDFVYTDEQARAVSVHSAGIMEALDKVYNARELVAELGGRQE
jgi:hypothetical protein